MNFRKTFSQSLTKTLPRHHWPVNFSGTAGRIISERRVGSDRGIVVLFRRSENVQRSAPTSRKLDEFENRGRKRKKMSFVSAFLLYVFSQRRKSNDQFELDCLRLPNSTLESYADNLAEERVLCLTKKKNE